MLAIYYNSVTPFAILTCLICAPWTKQYQLICHFVPSSSSLSYCGAADSCHKLCINPYKVFVLTYNRVVDCFCLRNVMVCFDLEISIAQGSSRFFIPTSYVDLST